MKKSIAVIGTGPAGLMAASQLVNLGYSVSLFEKRKGPGRKLLVAGSSGLNITTALPADKIPDQYGISRERMAPYLNLFPVHAWLDFIHNLGLKTFKGTSPRYFVEEMTAAGLLQKWTESLEKEKVQFFYEHEIVDFSPKSDHSDHKVEKVELTFKTPTSSQKILSFDAACFCLGGGSWEPTENPLHWIEIFKSKQIQFSDFAASNVGFKVTWPEAFLKEAEGKPIKNIKLTSNKGSRLGDLIITQYGLEGTPIYSLGQTGMITLDLKPDLSKEQILKNLTATSKNKENRSPLRQAKRTLNLCEGSLALLFHLGDKNCTPEQFADLLKNFPLQLLEPQPIAEAISSSGGVTWSELDGNLMLKNHPGIFLAGEMIDWDAPTGGFLIQACVSLGFAAAKGVDQFLQ